MLDDLDGRPTRPLQQGYRRAGAAVDIRVTKGSSMSHHGSKQNRPDTLTSFVWNYVAGSCPWRQVFVTGDRFGLQCTSTGRRSVDEDDEADGQVRFRSREAVEIFRDIALPCDSVPAWPLRDEPLRKQRNQLAVPSEGFNGEGAGHGAGVAWRLT
jgi:hypothetical protein